MNLSAQYRSAICLALLMLWIAPLSLANDLGDRQIDDQRFTGGQPTVEELHALQQAGVRHIINLRTDAELDAVYLAQVAQRDALTHHRLPIAGADGVTFDNAQRLDALLKEVGDDGVLVHCASGNRVGALMALRAGLAGEDVEAALATGRQWGLTSLAPVVQRRLESLAD